MVTSCTPPAPAAACAAGPCERKKYQFTQAIAATPATATTHSIALIVLSVCPPPPPRSPRRRGRIDTPAPYRLMKFRYPHPLCQEALTRLVPRLPSPTNCVGE